MIQQKQLAWPAYLVAVALCVIPPFDAVMQVLPPRMGDARWRFGSFGLLTNALLVPLLGLLIAMFAASFFEHRRLQRVLAVITGIVALLVLGALGMFALDALQVRGTVPSKAQLAFTVASLTASVKALLSTATLIAFTWAGFRIPKPRRPAPAVSGSNPLIIATAAKTVRETPVER